MNNKSNNLEYRIANPICMFCEHSYMKFFAVWCKIKNNCKGLCAKDCLNYKATMEHIDKRSPK